MMGRDDCRMGTASSLLPVRGVGCRALFLHPSAFTFLAVLLALCSAPASAQQLAVLQKMPVEMLPYTGGGRPDAEGMVGHNRGGFKSPELQRGGMHYMIRGIVTRNAEAIEEGWHAIEVTFREQTEQGNFSHPGMPRGGPSAVAFWLAELNQAILVLRESEFGPRYKDRIDALIPKIHKAAKWLAQPRYQERLKREDIEAPNRMLFDALAYGLSGILTKDEELVRTGKHFVDLAMTRYRAADGVFLERGGSDSSYQAVAALKLQVWLIYFPNKAFDAAVDRALSWERGRVGPDGEIDVTGNTRTGLGQEQWMGREKGVNKSEVTLCLLYHYARTGDERSLAAAQRIIDRRKKR